MELRDYLSEREISQSNFAKKLGVTRARICQIVHKTTNPSIVLAYRIKEETRGEVSIEELISHNAPNRLKIKRDGKDKKIRG